jgi:hypothetical protein
MEALKVSVDLTVAEWNVVINALAQRPYIEVADIIGNVKSQAEERMNNMNQMAQAMNEAAKPAPASKAPITKEAE